MMIHIHGSLPAHFQYMAVFFKKKRFDHVIKIIDICIYILLEYLHFLIQFLFKIILKSKTFILPEKSICGSKECVNEELNQFK